MITIIISIIVLGMFIGIYTMYTSQEKKQQDVSEGKSINSKQNKDTLIEEITCSVTGVGYDHQLKIITKIIDEMKKKNLFTFEPYLGITHKQMIKDGIRTYELAGESFPAVYLQKDNQNEFDVNAIMVFIEDTYGDVHHLGFIPASLSKKIRHLMNMYEMSTSSSIIGGKYKDVIINDKGQKEIKTFTSQYGIQIHLSFSNDQVIKLPK